VNPVNYVRNLYWVNYNMAIDSLKARGFLVKHIDRKVYISAVGFIWEVGAVGMLEEQSSSTPKDQRILLGNCLGKPI